VRVGGLYLARGGGCIAQVESASRAAWTTYLLFWLFRRDSKSSHLGYYTHYAVDGGKARIIVNALVTPFEVTENAPMLDLLWRSVFRWRLRPAQVTGDMAYGTTYNIAAVERAGIRAYVPLTGAGKAQPYFSK
jgi:hypothetical protein